MGKNSIENRDLLAQRIFFDSAVNYTRAYELFNSSTTMSSESKFLFGIILKNNLTSHGDSTFDSNRILSLWLEASLEGYEPAHLALAQQYSISVSSLTLSNPPLISSSSLLSSMEDKSKKLNCEKKKSHLFRVAQNLAEKIEKEHHLGFRKSKRLTEDDENSLLFSPSHKQDELIEFYRINSEGKDKHFLLLLGKLFLFGMSGLQVNYKMAKMYFEKISDSEPNAMGHLGELYLYGLDVQIDTKKAYELFYKSSNEGASVGHNGLGIMYRDGIVVKKDPIKALQYFKKASEFDYAEGHYNYAMMLINDANDKKGKGRNSSISSSFLVSNNQIFDSLVASIRGGYVLGYYQLARIHSNEELACSLTCFLLKRFLEYLPRTLDDSEEAIRLWNKGQKRQAMTRWLVLAEQGIETAMFNYAYSAQYFNNLKSAYFWYGRAANFGVVEAKLRLGDLYYYGLGVDRNYSLAFENYLMASERSNSAQASFNLGWMYQWGIGVDENKKLAVKYYDKAVKVKKESWLPIWPLLKYATLIERMENMEKWRFLFIIFAFFAFILLITIRMIWNRIGVGIDDNNSSSLTCSSKMASMSNISKNNHNNTHEKRGNNSNNRIKQE